MERRLLILSSLPAAAGLLPRSAWALSEVDAGSGMRAALERGAVAAVKLLGKADGFMGNEAVKIPLPGYLKDAARLLKATGQGAKVDELIMAMNRAAEAAAPEAQTLLVSAAKSISVNDALKIVKGGATSVTEYFAGKTRDPLGVKFLPVVAKATEKVKLADRYNALAAKATGLGLVRKEDANIQTYVTRKALDGLYYMIGEEEKKIRADPIATGSKILAAVFK